MKKILPSLLVSSTLFFPGAVAHAANLPLLDPNFTIVPTECTAACPCGIGAALQFVQNIMNVMISLAVLAMTIFIVWAGFLFVMSATNPESRSKARGMLINAFIGLFIVLSAWLIVDFIMKQLYDGGGKFGPWNKILSTSSGSLCIEKHDPVAITGLPGVVPINIVNGTSGNGGGTSGGTVPVGGAVSSLSAQAAANKILTNPNISLGTDSGNNCPGGNASARDNMLQVAAGKGMTRCPCGGGGSVAPSETLLNGLIDIANDGAKIRVNYIAGACHASGSNHYQGQAADIQRTSTLDAFFTRYSNVGGSTYQVRGVRVWFEDSSHYHVSPSGR